MPASTLERTARPRRSRTRSRNSNPRPALVISTLKPHQYDLRPACASLICPDCKTWVPITGIQAKKHKLVPHDTGRAGKDAAVRCQGSNRLVNVDVAFEVWQKRLEEGGAETDGRRSARQRYKPLPAQAKPVTKMTPAPMNADDALTAYREHLKKCRTSRVASRCGGTHRCADGARLAALYEQLMRTQKYRDRERRKDSRVDALLTRHRSAKGKKNAAATWAEQHQTTDAPKKALAKRSGTEVEEANNTCRIRRAGTVSDYRGRHVPTEPLHITA
ncbi:hypothetical protein N8I84_41840 (plasmid) [Streptomyces cynarae]|uniref:Uncharacterized protein n=1 Tax=Streptomyces cynarae TaxID=2981134 RepID=A0ABY6EF28_9ACTN|nr:hypothetical protein [Streptomyces cynarae]UXY24978.1 hypothetical protein N8I84_41840 [Streptomyces cynarae]